MTRGWNSVWPPTHGPGSRTQVMVPAGATTLMGRTMPALTGTSRASTYRSPLSEADRVTTYGALIGPTACSSERE